MIKSKKMMLKMMMLIILCFSLSGCSSLLIRNDALITDQSSTQKTVEHQSLVQLGTGLLQDASADGSQLLVFSTSKAPPSTYNIELYQHRDGNWSVINFLSSEKSYLSGVFSSDYNGIFYTETEKNGDGQEDIHQLLWTSLDRATTLVLTEENESIVTSLCRMPDEKVLCANNKNQVCIIDTAGNHENYAIDPDYKLETLSYNPVNDMIVFSATTQDNNVTNLYLAKKNQDRLEPTLLDQNIIDYDLNPETGSMLYLKMGDHENQLILYNSSGRTTQLNHSDITHAILSSDDQRILFTVPSDSEYSQYQMIEMMTANGKNIRQITSPRQLVSNLFLRGNDLFFSVVNNETDSSAADSNTILTLKINFEE